MSHARLAPSKSSRVLLCAASADREAKLPDEENSAPANEGTNAHWLLEQAVAEGNWPPAIMGFGPVKLQAALPYPHNALPEELIEQAKQCYEYVVRRAAELGAEIQAEAKVNPQLYTGRPDSYGSVDVTLVSPKVLEIVDLKTGGSLVEADCSQLKLYALGKMAEYADPGAGNAVPFETIRLTVFQPKRPGMDTIERYVDLTPPDLIAWAADVWIPAAKASDSPKAKATPTAEGCKYCKAQKHNTCPEYTASIEQAAQVMFQPIDGQAVAIVDPMQTQFSVETMAPEQISQFLEIWPLIKARGAEIEQRATELLLQRTEIPHFKLVRGRGSRGWALEDDDAQGKKLTNMKIKTDLVFMRKLRSPAQIMALTEIDTAKKEKIKKYIVNKEGALTVAHVSDPRQDALPQITFSPVVPEEKPKTEVNMDFLSLPDFLSL